jgi:hypothetical protein
LDKPNRSYGFLKFLFEFKSGFNKAFLKKQFAPRSLGLNRINLRSSTLAPLFTWVSDISLNPLTFSSSHPQSFPQLKQQPRERKGWRGLPAAREVRRRAGFARGGSGDHVEVRLVVGDGRNRRVHARRRASSSAACAPAYPRRDSSIRVHEELHGVTQRPHAQRIGKRCRGLPGPRTPTGS